MKAILLRVVSAFAGIVIVALSLGLIWGGSFLYLSALRSASPPPLWKSAAIVALLVLAFIAPCWVGYKLMRYAFLPWTKKVLIVSLATVAVGLIGLGMRYELKQREQARRQADYQKALTGYTQALKPGMTRRQVEQYIERKGAHFSQTCCVDPREAVKRHTWDDLVKIGQEEHPWFCSEHDVYIAFQFVDYEQGQTGFGMKDNDLDKLRAITIYHTLEGCL